MANLKISSIGLIIFLMLMVDCKKTEVDPQVKESQDKMNALVQSVPIKMEDLRKTGLALNDSIRNCNLKFQDMPGEKGISEKKGCYAEKQKEILERSKIPITALGDITVAFIMLKWELEEFNRKNKASKDTLVTVFRKGMSQLSECRKLTRNPGESEFKHGRRQEKCLEEKFYQICSQESFNKEDCNSIISMGVDYNWEESDKKAILINPASPEPELKKEKD